MNLPNNQSLVVAKAPDEVQRAVQSIDGRLVQIKGQLDADAAAARESKKVASALRIQTDAEYETAAAQMQQTLRHADAIEEWRESIVKPLNALVKRINGAFSASKKEWGEVIELAKGEGMRFLRAKEAAALAARAAAEAMARQAPQQIIGQGPTAKAYQGLAAHGAAPVPQAAGVAPTEHWSWELEGVPRMGHEDGVDYLRRAIGLGAKIDRIPSMFFELSAARLTQFVKQFKATAVIPGVRVFRDDHLSVRR